MRNGAWSQTFTGKQFWPIDPRPEDVDIIDIAHSLSMLCRYNGHCKRFYSVAEHSVYVSQIVPPEIALLGLLHDATEAYVSDVPRPLKPFLTGYRDIEDEAWACIAHQFGLPLDLPQAVKDADNAVLLAEKAQIMGPEPAPWTPLDVEPADVRIWCHHPDKAYNMFMHRFEELTRVR